MQIDIDELQRQLENTHREVQVLTTALQFASPSTSAQSFGPEPTPQPALDLAGPASPQLAPDFDGPIPPPSQPTSGAQSILASPADALALLRLQSPNPDPTIDPQLQTPPTFQQLEVTPNSQAMMCVSKPNWIHTEIRRLNTPEQVETVFPPCRPIQLRATS
jgi:hypothetical protein